MTKLCLVKTDATLPAGPVMDQVRAFLFGFVDGLAAPDKSAWRKFWRKLTLMEPGEFFEVEIVFPRSGPYHRRHMAIEAALFDAQERFDDQKIFMDWLKVGAGHVVWAPGPKGGIVPIPKSISYAKADQAEFEEFHRKVMVFLRGAHAAHFLWPHLKDGKDYEMMSAILEGFGE